ncbi:MAG TPA: hypothetical protein VNB22_20210 [Pyrinomonadaceae bacterium]|jgi:hypothetical protein|nr:hypothetical protein [Pyrinomonadaceae bacterium]
MSDELDTIEGLLTEARYFWTVIKNAPNDYQVTDDQAAMLNTLTTDAEVSRSTRTALENQLTTARADFKEKLTVLDGFFRPLRQSVKNNLATTDVQRAELHLTTGGGDDGDSLLDALAVAPLLSVEQTGIRQHTIYFFMPGEKSSGTKKPNGVHGCKIYVKIGDPPPASVKDCALITTDTKSPYIYTHEPEDAGKKAHYIGVWVDRDDAPSPPSETFSITIT